MEEEGKVRSRVYTDRPSYADFDAPHKFEAIKTIIAKRLIQHPKAICSYSGGSDSDILLDLIERTRKMFPGPASEICVLQYGTGNAGDEGARKGDGGKVRCRD